jgi:7-cyano-7-deazaguanine synthase
MKKVSQPVVYVLASGGIDSTACIHFYLQQRFKVRPLFVRFGQPACEAELASIKAVCKFYGLNLRTVTLVGLKVPRSGEIVGRNLLLFSVALMRSELSASLISLGIHAGTRYYDCNSVFEKLCDELLSGYTDGRTRLGIPFATWSKSQVWSYCRENGVPVELTWSCEASSKKPCGKCLSCRDKELLVAGA